LKLDRSIGNLTKKLDRVDSEFSSNNMTGLRYWKSKPIIPSDKWIELRDGPHALDYFPDNFDQLLTYISEDESEGKRKREDAMKWNSDFEELMEHTKNPSYGKMKCFRCLLNPGGDDPIFIGINRLVSKGLIDRQQNPLQFPCKVVNRFQCPYEETNTKNNNIPGTLDSNFNINELFNLERMAFVVEIALAKARKEDSRIRIKNKEELLHAL
jgi:hypothetical protein